MTQLTDYSRRSNAADLLTVTRFGGGSSASKVLERGVRVTFKPIIRAWRRAPHLPWPYAVVDHVGKALRTAPGTSREPFALPNCSGELVRSVHRRSNRVIVYLHGGAFLVGGQHLHRQMISVIAAQTGATLIVPNYRKLPRHAIADSIADGLDAYRLALSLASRPEDVVIMGDSAGGYLTFMIAIAAAREGLPTPAGLVAMSPLIEFEPLHQRRPRRRNRDGSSGCALFPAGSIGTLTRVAHQVHHRSGSGGVLPESAAESELDGLPPTLIQVSSSETLYAQSWRMATNLARHRVPCELQIWDGQVHVFQAANRVVPEAAQALGEAIDFVCRLVPAAAAVEFTPQRPPVHLAVV